VFLHNFLNEYGTRLSPHGDKTTMDWTHGGLRMEIIDQSKSCTQIKQQTFIYRKRVFCCSANILYRKQGLSFMKSYNKPMC
jgi:hypothetical protein